MQAVPVDWCGFLKNWVWPIGYTTAAASFVPVAYVILGLPEHWLTLAITILIYAAAHIVFCGIPATLILSKIQRESFGAYCALGLIASWIVPIYLYLKERAYLQSISDAEKRFFGLEHWDVEIVFFSVLCMGFSIFATAIWWHYNRRPKLEAAGLIQPPQGYHFRLF